MFKNETIEHRIMRLVEKSGKLSATSIALYLGVSGAVAVAHINVLLERGYLHHEGESVLGRTYKTGPRFAEWRAANQTEEELRTQVKTLEAALNLSTIALQNANLLLNELTAKPEGPFAILVGNTISGEFDTEELARQKALDVALNSGKPRSVRIIQVVDTLNVTQVVETSWQSTADQMNNAAAQQANFDAVAAMCDGNCEGCPNNA